MYVASYHATAGHYSVDGYYFASSGVDNAPLHAPQNGSGSLNGPYSYGSASVFPSNTYNSANYWVDVVFNYNAGPAPLAISTISLPSVAQSAAYNQGLAASGGTAPYSWSLVSGALPAGVTLSSSGQITGTPITPGTSSFSIQVTDSSQSSSNCNRGVKHHGFGGKRRLSMHNLAEYGDAVGCGCWRRLPRRVGRFLRVGR